MDDNNKIKLVTKLYIMLITDGLLSIANII